MANLGALSIDPYNHQEQDSTKQSKQPGKAPKGTFKANKDHAAPYPRQQPICLKRAAEVPSATTAMFVCRAMVYIARGTAQ